MRQNTPRRQTLEAFTRLIMLGILLLNAILPVWVVYSEELSSVVSAKWTSELENITVQDTLETMLTFKTEEESPEIRIQSDEHLKLTDTTFTQEQIEQSDVSSINETTIQLKTREDKTYQLPLTFQAIKEGQASLNAFLNNQNLSSLTIKVVAAEETVVTDSNESESSMSNPTIASEETSTSLFDEPTQSLLRPAIMPSPTLPIDSTGWDEVGKNENPYGTIQLEGGWELDYGIGAATLFGTGTAHYPTLATDYYRVAPNLRLKKGSTIIYPYDEGGSKNKATRTNLILTPEKEINVYEGVTHIGEANIKKYKKTLSTGMAFRSVVQLKTKKDGGDSVAMVTEVQPDATTKTIKVTQTLVNTSDKKLSSVAFGSSYDMEPANTSRPSMYVLDRARGFYVQLTNARLTYTIPQSTGLAWRVGKAGYSNTTYYKTGDKYAFSDIYGQGDESDLDYLNAVVPTYKYVESGGTGGFIMKSPVRTLDPNETISVHYYIGMQAKDDFRPEVFIDQETIRPEQKEGEKQAFYHLTGNWLTEKGTDDAKLEYAVVDVDKSEPDNPNDWQLIKNGTNDYWPKGKWFASIPADLIKNQKVIVRATSKSDGKVSIRNPYALLLVEKKITPVIKAYKGNQEITQDVAAVAGNTVTYKIEIPKATDKESVIYKELNFEAALAYNGKETLEPEEMKLVQGENSVENAEIKWDPENKKITVNAKNVTANIPLYLVYEVGLPKDDLPVDTGELKLKTTATITKGTTADFDLEEATSKHTLPIQIGELKWHTVPSNIIFETGKVSGKRQTLEVDKIADVDGKPIGLEVSDTRIGTNGWRINAKLQQDLNFGIGDQKDVLKFSQGGKTTPIPINTEFKPIWSHKNSSAEEGIYKVPLKRPVDSPDKDRGMFLDVPGGVMKKGEYGATIEWQLGDGPGPNIGDGGDSE